MVLEPCTIHLWVFVVILFFFFCKSLSILAGTENKARIVVTVESTSDAIGLPLDAILWSQVATSFGITRFAYYQRCSWPECTEIPCLCTVRTSRLPNRTIPIADALFIAVNITAASFDPAFLPAFCLSVLAKLHY